MNLILFVNFVRKSTDDSMPINIHPMRWRAMVNWCKKRFDFNEPLVYEDLE